MEHNYGFLNFFKKTFTSSEFYRSLVEVPFKYSLNYFLIFFVIYSLVAGAIFSYRFILPLKDVASLIPDKVLALYPDDLVITIEKGKLSTNYSEPYRLPSELVLDIITELEDSAKSKVLGDSVGTNTYAIVIDTEGVLDDYYDYQTYVLVTEDYLAYTNEDGNMEVFAFTEVPDIAIDHGFIADKVNLIRPFLEYAVLALIVLSILVSLAVFPLGYLIYCAFFSLLVLLIGKVVGGLPLNYKKSYQISLHLATIYPIFSLLLLLSRVSIEIPFMRLAVLSVIWILIASKIRKSKPNQALLNREETSAPPQDALGSAS